MKCKYNQTYARDNRFLVHHNVCGDIIPWKPGALRGTFNNLTMIRESNPSQAITEVVAPRKTWNVAILLCKHTIVRSELDF